MEILVECRAERASVRGERVADSAKANQACRPTAGAAKAVENMWTAGGGCVDKQTLDVAVDDPLDH